MTESNDPRFQPGGMVPGRYQSSHGHDPSPASAPSPYTLDPGPARPPWSPESPSVPGAPDSAGDSPGPDSAGDVPPPGYGSETWHPSHHQRAPGAGSDGQHPSPYQASPYAPGPDWMAPPSGRGGKVRTAKSRRNRVIGVIAGIYVSLNLLVQCVSAILPDSSSSSPGPAPPPQTEDIEATWITTPTDLDPELSTEARFWPSLDGGFDSRYIVDAGPIWVVGTEGTGDRPFQLFGLNTANGTESWNVELPAGQCGHTVIEETLACVRQDGDIWSLVLLDVTTGEEISAIETDLDSVRAVHRTELGLLVIGDADPAPHAQLTLIQPDGEAAWSLDVADLDGAEQLFDDFLSRDFSGDEQPEESMERLRWRDLDDGMVLLWSTPGVALIDPDSGTVLVHRCLRATTIGQAYFCLGDEGITRHDLSGEVLWTLPDMELATPQRTSDARPLALTEDYQFVAVDWETGEVGAHLADLQPRGGGFSNTTLPPAAIGTAEHTFITDDETLIALEPDSDAIAWQIDLGDRYARDVTVLDDVAVFDDYPNWAVEAASGAELWERRIRVGIYVVAIGEHLAATGLDEIAMLEMP